jgi:hypothetical protein
LPHNSKVLFLSAAVFLCCVFQIVARSIVEALQIMKKSSLVVARSIEKSLQIMKKSSFVKFLFYSLMLIASIVYVLISMNVSSDSVDDFALKSFDHDIFMNQLSMPLFMYENDALGNKSELYYVSQGSYACPMTISQGSYVTTTNLTSHASTAALTSSCEPSVGFFFSFGDFFLCMKMMLWEIKVSCITFLKVLMHVQ